MGNLMGNWRYKEPSTVEECDSTWESDSESDEQHQQQLGREEEDSGISEPISPSETGRGTEQLDHGSPQFGDMLESSTRMKRSFYAAKDLYKYRHSYPNYKEPRRMNEYRNLRFYLNKIPLVPDGIYIEEILTKWRGDYDKLEHNHTYIQWLFPLREQGLNYYAQELTQDEIKEFQSTREAKRRFLLAYTIMLDFFGIKLLDKNGNVTRAQNWQDRFQHLNESQHNYLRITRILKSLGELGFEHFKFPLVRLLLEEALVEGTLPNMRHSALEYFVYTLRQHSQRRALLRFAQRHYHPPENFIWGPPRRKRVPGTSGCSGTRAGKPEVTDRSAGKARSPVCLLHLPVPVPPKLKVNACVSMKSPSVDQTWTSQISVTLSSARTCRSLTKLTFNRPERMPSSLRLFLDLLLVLSTRRVSFSCVLHFFKTNTLYRDLLRRRDKLESERYNRSCTNSCPLTPEIKTKLSRL